jgi:hypothetical protein
VASATIGVLGLALFSTDVEAASCDLPLIDKRVGFVDAVDPDLRDFKGRGGKLLLYAGWGDTTSRPRTRTKR